MIKNYWNKGAKQKRITVFLGLLQTEKYDSVTVFMAILPEELSEIKNQILLETLHSYCENFLFFSPFFFFCSLKKVIFFFCFTLFSFFFHFFQKFLVRQKYKKILLRQNKRVRIFSKKAKN